MILGIVLIGAAWGFTEPASDAPVRAESAEPNALSVDRAHASPPPQGEDYEPWRQADRLHETVGEYYRQTAYKHLAQQLDIPADGTRATIDLAADLALDPGNPYAQHGTAVTVWAEGQHVAFLPDESVPDYLDPLERLDAESKHLTVRARLYLNYDASQQKWRPSLMIKLPRPEQILPPAMLPPGDVELIPDGRVIQVAGEENHMQYLSTIVDPDGPADVAATLRPAQMGVRSFYDTVQVLVDGNEVGTFSRAMGEQTVSLVKLIESAGKIPVARATVEGNALRAEVKVRMQRAAEFDHDRIRELQQLARDRNAKTNRRGETFDWSEDDLAAEGGRNRGRESREQQDREVEDGGA